MNAAIITDKGRNELTVSDCWVPSGKRKDQVTTEQFIRMCKEWDGKDLVKIFAILTGMEYRTLFDHHDYLLEETLYQATRFIYEDPFDLKSLKVPETITIEGKQLKVSRQVAEFSIGQSQHVRQAINGADVYEELIAFACAIYLQPLFDGEDFDFHKAMELEQKILKMPIVETYALGFFLLRPLTPSGRSFMRELSRVKTILQNRFMRKGAA